jgi:UDPglucose 6-dehydrogenase
MWLVAREIGVDLDPVAATVARSAEGSINPEYGIRGGAPYGGVCLPKDTQGFLGFADSVGVSMPLLSAVVETNDKLAEIVDHEIDTADIAGRAADHARLRVAATTGAVAPGREIQQAQSDPS